MIRNVIAVDRILSLALDGMSWVSDGAVSVPVDIGWESLSIQVPAKLSISNKVDAKNVVWTAQLVFRTCQDVSGAGHWCYRVRLASGESLLIGSCERPYPVTLVSEVLPDNLTDSQLQEVTVTLSSGRRIPQIR